MYLIRIKEQLEKKRENNRNHSTVGLLSPAERYPQLRLVQCDEFVHVMVRKEQVYCVGSVETQERHYILEKIHDAHGPSPVGDRIVEREVWHTCEGMTCVKM